MKNLEASRLHTPTPRNYFAALLPLFLASLLPLAGAQGNATVIVDTASSGTPAGFGASGLPVVSEDGRYCVFVSLSNDLDPADTDILSDVYFKDLWTNELRLVSVGMTGQSGNLSSGGLLGISSDGRFVVFDSQASNLVSFDSNGMSDVFIYDQVLKSIKCISVNPSGDPSNGSSGASQISGDGRYVCFQSGSTDIGIGSTGAHMQVYVYDTIQGTVEFVSLDPFGFEGDGPSRFPNISYDGRYVVFRSWASNLVPNDTNGEPDYFVKDRWTGAIERVNVDSSGGQAIAPSWSSTLEERAGISDDGRFVAFISYSDNLVTQDTNSQFDVFVRDRMLGQTELASIDSQEHQSIYPVGVYPSRVDISGDGRYVCFDTLAPGLAPPDTASNANIFVRDRLKGVTEMVDIGANGEEPNFNSGGASLSRTGRFVAFWSQSSNLVPNDAVLYPDVFLRDRMTGGPDVDLSNVVAGQAASLTITGASPGGVVVLGASLNGQGILLSQWGPLELNGVSAFFAFVMDGAGQASAQVPLNAALVGLPLWVQGVDLTMDFPTSVWAGTIQ